MDYDAIVVGTGFGGTIAATLLAQRQKKVLMLERGTWWVTPEKLGKPPATGKPAFPDWARGTSPPQPLQYWPRPDHKEGLLDLFSAIRHTNNPHGLYNYRMFDEAHILTASGVGGGSLIYSNVTLRPSPEVLAGLKQSGLNLTDADYKAAYDWMATYRGKLSQIVTKIPLPGRNVAKLDPESDYLYLDRSRKLRDAVEKLGTQFGVVAEWAPLDLSVIEYDSDPVKSDAGTAHTFCERQGRCILGCLPAAMHTLSKTLYDKLLLDPRLGVALQPLCEVQTIKPVTCGYEVAFIDHRNGAEQTVTAPMVFLAAGTLGTTEILLRSRQIDGGPKLSPALGSKFSSNGDFAAFAFGTDTPVYSTRGPINTCYAQFKVDGSHITVEDSGIPGMLAAVTNAALGVLDSFVRRNLFKQMLKLSWVMKTLPNWKDFLPHVPNTEDPNDARTEAEMVANIFFFNVMGQDRGDGQFSLDNGRLDLTWKHSPSGDPIFSKIETLLHAISGAMGARYIPFPLWSGFLQKKIIVVHPLGGCPIGKTNGDGVVDEFGRLFDGKTPNSTDTLPGIYIVDGSTIPGPLAANPTLTIATQAIKAVTAALQGVPAARRVPVQPQA